jgi:uncharacterized protein with PQ loop repeat
MAVTILGIAAGAWGLLMAVSPMLQMRQMWRRRSSEDVSIGYFGILLPGFALWVAYGSVRSDWPLIIPNLVALVVGGTTVAVARYFRQLRRAGVAADRVSPAMQDPGPADHEGPPRPPA